MTRAVAAMTLTFLGTRGEIDVRSHLHRRHSSLLVSRGAARVMIDCGRDWRRMLNRVAPTAIVLTHAHEDHVAGLVGGAPCPVYAASETWQLIDRFPISDRRSMPLRKSIMIDRLRFMAFPVRHSIRAPAVGYRVSANVASFFYAPDVARIPDALTALRGVALYIGDGATMKRSMVRRRNGRVIGHASIAAQLAWCGTAGVERAIFTHCGSPIVRGDDRTLAAMLGNLGRSQGVAARFARDGEVFDLVQDLPIREL